MKKRSDFVTNSSSSSFILAFESEESIARELANENTNGHFETIYADVMEAERCSKDKMLEEYREEIYYTVRWQVENFLRHRKNMSYTEVHEFSKTEEFKQMVEKEIQNKVDELSEKMGEKSVFVEVEYSDHCDSDLEHYIMPELSCCMARISHH